MGDGCVVPYLDVLVHHRDELDEVHRRERSACRGERLPRCVRAERDHGREPPGAALGHGHGPHRRDEAAQPALEARGDRHAADHGVLGVKARQDGLVERVAAAGEAVERRRRGVAVALVAAVELRDWALLDARVEVELPLQHDLAAGGHLERNAPAARELDGLTQERGCDEQLVLAAREVEAGRDRQRRVIADRHRDRQALAALARRTRRDREVVIGGDADQRSRAA